MALRHESKRLVEFGIVCDVVRRRRVDLRTLAVVSRGFESEQEKDVPSLAGLTKPLGTFPHDDSGEEASFALRESGEFGRFAIFGIDGRDAVGRFTGDRLAR